MARALRIEIPGGRFHVTARGNERKDIFRNDTDRFHFLGLLAEVPERFGARIHAYVLMNNHYHLVVETPEANLSLKSLGSHLVIGHYRVTGAVWADGFAPMVGRLHLAPLGELAGGLDYTVVSRRSPGSRGV